MQKTKVQIIDETVEYYSADPKRRAVANMDRCFYYIEGDNRLCAFSRCMIDPRMGEKIAGGVRSLVKQLYPNTDMSLEESKIMVPTGILKPEYDGHNIVFWTDIQGIHDTSINWNDEGLSGIGKARVGILKERYKD